MTTTPTPSNGQATGPFRAEHGAQLADEVGTPRQGRFEVCPPQRGQTSEVAGAGSLIEKGGHGGLMRLGWLPSCEYQRSPKQNVLQNVLQQRVIAFM